ncbi:MAG: ABC transporter permease [Micromonosporaceae bacterium]|nr:ABC transporter permease [Micromonosporaceae bacterium]
MKLLLRDPLALFFAVFFTPAVVVILGSIPSFRKPDPALGGVTIISVYVPIAVLMVVAMVGLFLLPTYLGTYRERGILRRLAVTPARPSWLLVAQLATALMVAVATVVLVLAIGRLAFSVALPGQALGYALAFLLSAAALFALGLVVAAVAPNGRAASGIGNVAFFPLMFFAGLWTPREVMPRVLQRIADFSPLGAGERAMHDATLGHFPSLAALAVLVGYLVVFGGMAVRLFRWE